MKALVVEDDYTSRLLLKELLARHGRVDTTALAREGLELAEQAIERQEPYDLVCLDIMMPEMDGHQALQQLRQLENRHRVEPGREVKVIMVSAL